MTTNRAIVITRILDREGGIKDVGDGMGVTRYGQTDAWLATYKLTRPKNRNDAADNFEKWLDVTGLGDVCDLDVDLGDDVCDFEINAGPEHGVRAMQAALRVTVDGQIGPKTRAAIATADPIVIQAEVFAADVSRRGALVEAHPEKFAQYAGGWANRDAGKIRLLARRRSVIDSGAHEDTP